MGEITKKEFAALLAVLLLGAIVISLQWRDPVDDAYVSFVYARNLAEGRGLTFNPGEKIEGYSNFAWVMILAALHGVAPVPGASQALGFLLGISNILLLFLVARECDLGAKSLAVTALYACDLRAAAWSVEGLETPLYVFSILLTILLYLKKRSGGLWAIPALLAAMTRPEGAVVFMAAAIHRCWRILRERGRPDRPDWVAAAVFCVPFLIYNLWRIRYFGSILPNTFYARGGARGPIFGLIYMFFTLWRGWGILSLIMLLLFVVGITRRGAGAGEGLMVFWLATGVVVMLATGGDWMPNGRFFVPLLPAVYIFCVRGAEKMRFKEKRSGYFFLAVLLAVNLAGVIGYEMGNSFDKRWSRNQSSFYMPVAEWLNEHHARGHKVVLSDVGYITYYSGIYVIDTLGLTNRRLARVPGGSAWATDLDYVFDQKPEYIIRMERAYDGGGILGHVAFDREVIKDPRFFKEFKEIAAIRGYRATERSLADFIKRSYEVTFRIYRVVSP